MGILDILLFVALQSASDSENLAKTLEAINAIDKVDCSDPSAKCPSSSHENSRLPLAVETDVRSAKDALEKDGTACAIIGQTICETKPRPILRSSQTPQETINSSIDPD